ncbi:MAG: phosphoribosyltransferase family protein [Thermaerobacter sp.]|nr:phosphoribosyltransferase family protein [Thermaerobacter sp.]
MAREARYARVRRIVGLTRRLTAAPGRLYSLAELAAETGAARSTVSEDVALIDEVLREAGQGGVETVTGAAGGVRWLDTVSAARARELVQALIVELSDPERIIPGGFLYMTDVIFSPHWAERIGALIATRFLPLGPDMVLTMETKGIPLALTTARALGLPLAVARRESRVTEGPSLSLNVVSSSGRIGAMSLPRRAIPQGSRVLIVDDFMKGGSTARGLEDLCRELGAKAIGCAALCETPAPNPRKALEYFSLLRLEAVDDAKRAVSLSPAESFTRYLEEAGSDA